MSEEKLLRIFNKMIRIISRMIECGGADGRMKERLRSELRELREMIEDADQ